MTTTTHACFGTVCFGFSLGRNWIPATTATRMAPANAFQPEPPTRNGSVNANRFQRIGRAARCKSAAAQGAKERRLGRWQRPAI